MWDLTELVRPTPVTALVAPCSISTVAKCGEEPRVSPDVDFRTIYSSIIATIDNVTNPSAAAYLQNISRRTLLDALRHARVDLLSARCFINVDLPEPGLPFIQKGGVDGMASHFGNSVLSTYENGAVLDLIAASCSRFEFEPWKSRTFHSAVCLSASVPVSNRSLFGA